MRTNQRLAQLWLDALATELGASAGTIGTYTDDLSCYLAWLDENSLGLDDVGLEQIRDYIASLDQRGYAGSTIARRITVARGLHRFLIAEELGSRDPTSPSVGHEAVPQAALRPVDRRDGGAPGDRPQACGRSLGRPLPSGRLCPKGGPVRDPLCLGHAHQRGPVPALRCRASWHPHAAGARQGRQAAARAAASSGRSRPSPSGRSWPAPIPAERPPPWLFHSVRNGTKALTRQAALLEIKEAAVAAGLASPERVSPHVLRHAFATHMHSGGTDLRVLQELLGHAGIETTQIYTHLDTSRLHHMVRDLHPLNAQEISDQ